MTSRPILFSGPMVRAILAGTKTQTRRLMKEPPASWIDHWGYTCFTPVGSISGRGNHPEHGPAEKFYKIPYGIGPTPKREDAGGDRLWVREAFAINNNHASDEYPRLVFRADMAEHDCDGISFCPIASPYPSQYSGRWKPGIHMPRWASRITLEIVNVRVERLQDLTEEDAIAEGVDSVSIADVPRNGTLCRRDDFGQLWNIINGKRAPWSSNPWVWVIDFKHLASEASR